MTGIETAIKKAIEGGYDPVKNPYKRYKLEDFILLDPLFWQALGKAEGWKYISIENGITVRVKRPTNYISSEEWLVRWHSFIDHIARGKDINSFFEDLLQEITKEQ